MIENIPAVLWGKTSDKLLIAIHGNQSNKTDTGIALAAEVAAKKGYRVLSFDLPEHGDRKEEPLICDAQNCVHDLKKVMKYAHTLSDNISVFACSIGVYFTMLAYEDEPVRKALFLSPVVNMERLIENMMLWFDVSVEQLKEEKEIATPINTLYWHYYQYVMDHPIKWNKPTVILYGEKDELCEYEYVKSFAESCNAEITVLEGSEHFFHTPQQLDFLQEWLFENID